MTGLGLGIHTETAMTRYPMFFKQGGLVAGCDFIASVTIHGRCLLEDTDPTFYSFFGVNPGAVAGDGTTVDEALRNFLDNVRLNVFDISDRSKTFEEFEANIRAFFEAANASTEKQWIEAVQEVRSGKLELEGFRKEDGDSRGAASVQLVAEAQNDNTPKTHARLAPSLNGSASDLATAA